MGIYLHDTTFFLNIKMILGTGHYLSPGRPAKKVGGQKRLESDKGGVRSFCMQDEGEVMNIFPNFHNKDK